MSHPDRETLAAYWLGELADADEAALEEHLFECAPCSSAWEGAAGLSHALAKLIPPVVTGRQLERLEHQGQRTRVTELEPGQRIQAVFARDLDLLVFALKAPLQGTDRVDLELSAVDGTHTTLLESVPLEAGKDRLLIACQRHYAETFPASLRFRVIAVAPTGRTALGDYFVDHVMEPV